MTVTDRHAQAGHKPQSRVAQPKENLKWTKKQQWASIAGPPRKGLLIMFSDEIRYLLARFLDVPADRIDLFCHRLTGLRDAGFPDTGLILDLILNISNLPERLKEEVLMEKQRRRQVASTRSRPFDSDAA